MWFYLVTWNFWLLKNKMICFEDHFALLWLYWLKLLLQIFRNYYRLFFLSCPSTNIFSFDFSSPFVSWGIPYRGTKCNFLGHNIWIIFNNISVMLSYVTKCFISSFLETTNFFTNTGNTAMNVTEMFILSDTHGIYFCLNCLAFAPICTWI